MKRLGLLAAEALAFGLTIAWVLVPATTTFLDVYGSGLLPVTYIGAAVAGVATTAGLNAAFGRRPLAAVAARVLGGLVVALLLAWAALAWSDATWVSFALLVLIPIMVPVGFVFVVGQAGALLDVRALKAGYGRVIAGFALGLTVGGLVAPLWIAVLGRTENVLLPAAAAVGAFLALVLATRSAFPDELSAMAAAGEIEGEAGPNLRILLRDRYVRLIIAFQFLSAIESQWLDFLVFSRASSRYEGEELARFISAFTAIAYGTDIVVLLLLAGLLLRRFGLRYGLTANSAGVLTLVTAMLVAGMVQGAGSTMVFVFIVAARVTDLVFSDCTSRTSLSAAYQVVPNRLRLAAQAGTEGLAVPVAIGVSGAVLLVLDGLGAIDTMLLPALTAGVVVVWAFVAVGLYRGYRVNLLSGLRHRELDPAALTLEDADAAVLERLLGSADERDVRLGLDTLVTTRHPELEAWLHRLAVDEREGVRTEALTHLLDLDPTAARPIALEALADPAPSVRTVAVEVLGALGDDSSVDAIRAVIIDSSDDVRVAVARALTRSGDDATRASVAADIHRASASAEIGERATAARMLGAVADRSSLDEAALRRLVHDPDVHVRRTALDAVAGPHDAVLLDDVLMALRDRRSAGAAANALARIGDGALDLIDRGLADDSYEPAAQEQLARALRLIGGPAAIAVLRSHLHHPEREVGLAVMAALGALVSPGDDEPSRSVAVGDLEHAGVVLHALLSFGSDTDGALLHAALLDELTLARERVLAALSTSYGAEAVRKVAFQFAQQDERSHTLALEWLDVTLAGSERAAIALLEPDLADEERSARLDRALGLAPATETEILLDLVVDPDGRWRRPWLAACALQFAEGRAAGPAVFDAVAARSAGGTVDGPDDIVGETHAGLVRRRALDPV